MFSPRKKYKAVGVLTSIIAAMAILQTVFIRSVLALTVLVGNSAHSPSNTSGNNVITCNANVATATGTASQGTANFAATANNDTFQTAIYTTLVSTTLSGLLASSTSTTLNGSSGAFNTTYSSPPTITSGTTYYSCSWASSGSELVNYDVGAANQNLFDGGSHTYPTWPASFSTGSFAGNYEIYNSGTVSSTGNHSKTLLGVGK